jgi:hypothetical protein
MMATATAARRYNAPASASPMSSCTTRLWLPINYEAAIQDEWRNIRRADFGGPGIGPNKNTCNQDKPKNYLSDLDADVDEHVKVFDQQRDCICERGPRRQSSDVATLMRDHQERMATLYAERERELQEEWRCGK